MSFYTKQYKKKISHILDDAIKSALYIDENALEPYSKEATLDSTDIGQTQKLSRELYQLFYKSGVSLTVHKFEDVESTKLHLSNKDLILLDWHLDGVTSGEEFALEVLENIIKEEHIHFCCIYTNNSKDDVLRNCISYFSGYNKAFYEGIIDEFEDQDDFNADIKPFLNKVSALSQLMNDDEIYKYKKILKKKNKTLVSTIGTANCFPDDMSFSDKLKSLTLANTDLKKSSNSIVPILKLIDIKKNVFSINNTIVFVIKKNHDTDKKKLINKIREQLLLQNNSFLLMLGIEMQNIIKKSGAFISPNLINLENKTLAYHWRQSIKSDHSSLFYDLINSVMIDQIDKNYLSKKFSILDQQLLYKNISPPKDEELCKLNAFYNGLFLPEDRKVNFGDIFLGVEGEYFLCITPLCDCLQPKNINNKYFFVKGTKHPSISTAIKLSDQAFLSYIGKDTCIIWSGFSFNGGSNKDKFLPIYIKPVQLSIQAPEIKEGKFKYLQFGQEEIKGVLENKVDEFELEYKYTLRQQYAQRIANFAFSHSVRVGIDFVKKS